MGKKNANYADPVYWQSAQLNEQYYTVYKNWILSLAMNRYRWVGLPETCDPRYLELTLCTQGVATIAKAPDLDTWVSTMAATNGPLNVYDNPTQWESVGNNGWNFRCDPSNAALIWDNTLRYPIWNIIDMYAKRLAQIDRTMDINLLYQRTGMIFTAPQEKRNDLINLIKETWGGEPGVLGYKGLETIKAEMFLPKVEFTGEEMETYKDMVWNEIYTFLGIENLDKKSERMIEAEVTANNEPTDIRALDGLRQRRQACKELKALGLDVEVYWAQDNESTNYNILHNIQEYNEVVEGNDNA